MTIEPAMQYGALGLLLLVLVGLYILAQRVAPSIKEFLLGLVSDLKANTAALHALSVRVELAEERIKAHVTSTASGVEDEVREQANKTGDAVTRTGQHVAVTVGEAVDAIRASRPDEDFTRRPSPTTPMRGFPALRAMPASPPSSTRGVPRPSVLIVEDDIAMARAIKQCLTAAIGGIVVTLAKSAPEALSAFNVQSTALPVVAIIDCNLGDGAFGWDVANRAPRSVHIILMSGHVDETMLSRLADGVQAVWLRKPLDMDELVGLVRDRLEAGV